MEMTIEQLADGIKKVLLVGDLDIVGAREIDLPFSTLAGSTNKLLVDLSQVDFLSSIGIRTLMLNAQVVKRRGGMIVLLNPQPIVEKILQTSGTDQIIPIFKESESALAALRG